MKTITNKLFIVATLFISSSLISANASFSLIGQDVDLALISLDQGSDTPNFIADDEFENPINVTVIEGEVEGQGLINGFMDIDIEAGALGVLFPGGVIVDGTATSLNMALGLGPLDFIGVLFANLSWGIDDPAKVVGITNLQTNIVGFTDSNVLFDNSNVAFNILDLVIDAESFVIVDLVVESDAQQVPVGGTLALFGLALVAMRFARFR